jgi:hypothetical protein
VLKALPGTVAGTRQQPLREEAAAAAARIADAEIDRFIWEAPSLQRPAAGIPADVAEKLSHGVREVISHPWRPWVFPAGKHPIEAYRYFTEPAETLFTLARAYRFLDAGLQLEVKQHVANMAAAGGPLDSPTGQRLGKVDAGEVRTRYAVPDRLLRVVDDIQRTGIAQLYPFWLWAHVTSDWSKVEKDWAGLRLLLDSAPTRIEEDCRNGYVAGLIAYCRVAQRVGDEEALRRGVAKTRGAIRERLAFEFAHPRGGLISQVPVGRSIFSRWRHLTPEVGRLLATHAGPVHRELMAVQVDFHRPTWWLAWNVELMVRNESPFSLPTMSAEIFSARAMVLQEPGEKLAAYLDLPWCRADLFFLQKLASCAEAHTHVTWRDVRDAR